MYKIRKKLDSLILVISSGNQNISQGKAIDKLINMAAHYLDEKQLEKELDEISNDKKWMEEDLEWAELDLT